MNVLKKDIFSKTGAKSKRKFVDFSAMASGMFLFQFSYQCMREIVFVFLGPSSKNQNPLPFLVQQMNENDELNLSQSSVSSSGIN